MRWEDERYVRLYTRDTPEWTLMSWEARSLFSLLLRSVDRAGILSLGRSGLKGVASLLRMPLQVVERAMPELLDDGCVAIRGEVLVIRNFIEAQEAVQSDAARQRVARERARDKARAAELGIILDVREDDGDPSRDGTVTKRDASVTKRDSTITVRDTTDPTRALQSDATAQRVATERARDSDLDLINACEGDNIASRGVTAALRPVTEPSRAVTRCHGPSRAVTPSRAVPSFFGSADAAGPVGPDQPHRPTSESTENGEGIQVRPGTGDEAAPHSAADGPRTARPAPDDPEPQPALSAPKEGRRRAKAKSEVDCPGSDATGDEVEAFLQKWQITGDEAEVSHFLDHHRSKGNRFKDWGAAWRTWKRNGQRFGRIAGTAPPPQAPRKHIEQQQLVGIMDNLRNLRPGGHVR